MKIVLLVLVVFIFISFSLKEDLNWTCHTSIKRVDGTEGCYVSLVKAKNEQEANKLFFNWVWADTHNKGGIILKGTTNCVRVGYAITLKNFPAKPWTGK